MATDAAAVLDPDALELEILELQGDMEDKGLDSTGSKNMYQRALSFEHPVQKLLCVRDSMCKRLQKHSESAANPCPARPGALRDLQTESGQLQTLCLHHFKTFERQTSLTRFPRRIQV